MGVIKYIDIFMIRETDVYFRFGRLKEMNIVNHYHTSAFKRQDANFLFDFDKYYFSIYLVESCMTFKNIHIYVHLVVCKWAKPW